MVLWQGILVVLGCIAAGLLFGLLLLRVLHHKKAKELHPFNKAVKPLIIQNPEVTVDPSFSNVITKSNGHEDPLEVLIKNHKNNIVVEKAQQPKVINVPDVVESAAAKNPQVIGKEEKPAQPDIIVFPAGVESAAAKNPPVIGKEEKPAQPDVIAFPAGVEITAAKNPPVIGKEEKLAPHVMHWTELVTPSDQLRREEEEKTHGMPAVKEPVAVSQKSISSGDEPQKTAVPGILTESGTITRETPPLAEKQEKSPKSAIPIKSETITRKSHTVVHDKTKGPKPPVPEAVIIKPEIIQQKPPELKPEESVKIEPTAAPAVEKPEIALKTDLVMEMEVNLITASQPWDNKLRSFQTKCWDSKHGETDLFLNSRYQEMIQLYVDIGLANNITWLATEIGHRTKELDESYIKLRSGIADNIKKLLS